MGVDHGEIEHSLRGSSHCSRTVWFDKGSVVFLNFTQIIVGNPDSCDKNFIKVHDGLNAKGPLLSEYCKSQSSSTLTSKSNNVYIISKSGSSSAVSFHARYRVVTKPAVKRRPSSKPGPENEHTTLIVPVTKVKQRPSSRPGHENKHTTLIVPLTKAKVKQRPSSRPGHENKHTTLTVPLTKAKVKQRPSSRPGHDNKHTTLIVPQTKVKDEKSPTSKFGPKNEHTTLIVPLTKDEQRPSSKPGPETIESSFILQVIIVIALVVIIIVLVIVFRKKLGWCWGKFCPQENRDQVGNLEHGSQVIKSPRELAPITFNVSNTQSHLCGIEVIDYGYENPYMVLQNTTKEPENKYESLRHCDNTVDKQNVQDSDDYVIQHSGESNYEPVNGHL